MAKRTIQRETIYQIQSPMKIAMKSMQKKMQNR